MKKKLVILDPEVRIIPTLVSDILKLWDCRDDDNVSAYCPRNTENNLVLPQRQTDYFKRSLSYSGAQLLNNLPID